MAVRGYAGHLNGPGTNNLHLEICPSWDAVNGCTCTPDPVSGIRTGANGPHKFFDQPSQPPVGDTRTQAQWIAAQVHERCLLVAHEIAAAASTNITAQVSGVS